MPEGLRKLTPEEMITKAEQGDWGNAGEVVLKDEKGNVIPRDSLRKITDFDAFWTDPYADEDGKVMDWVKSNSRKRVQGVLQINRHFEYNLNN